MARIPERAAAADANLSGKEIYDLARLKKQRSVGGGGEGAGGQAEKTSVYSFICECLRHLNTASVWANSAH